MLDKLALGKSAPGRLVLRTLASLVGVFSGPGLPTCIRSICGLSLALGSTVLSGVASLVALSGGCSVSDLNATSLRSDSLMALACNWQRRSARHNSDAPSQSRDAT